MTLQIRSDCTRVRIACGCGAGGTVVVPSPCAFWVAAAFVAGLVLGAVLGWLL